MSRMQQATDEEIAAAVVELYPADTITGGVKASQLAEYLGMSTRGMRPRVKRLAVEGELRRLAGLRGPTYAPPERDG